MEDRFIISYQIKTALMFQDQILSVQTANHEMTSPTDEPNVILVDLLARHQHEKVVGFEILDIREGNVWFNEDYEIFLN
ncbi:MAG: hypothetical protein AAF598_11590 [Bacteroidota bacterium]